QDALTDGDEVAAYAYARTGYHRGLDALRRSGWRGQGPIPASHAPNRGFLRALAMLGETSRRLGDEAEADRVTDFLREAAPTLLGCAPGLSGRGRSHAGSVRACLVRSLRPRVLDAATSPVCCPVPRSRHARRRDRRSPVG